MASSNRFSGNKFSLRSKPLDQIKRIDIITKLAPKVGDILVTTWSNVILVLATLGAGALWVSKIISTDNFAVIIPNLIPSIFIAIGFLLVALNVALTNPSIGSQFTTSLSFLRGKYQKRGQKGKKQKVRPYRLIDIEGTQEIVETQFKRKERYMMVYQVRGSVSPVSFEGELEQYARLNASVLTNMDMDATINSINSIQSAEVQQKTLGSNATPEMIRRRNANYRTVKNLKHNQQLKTLVVITSRTFNSMYNKADALENAFKKGLVIGYVRLEGKELKKALNNIFG